MTRPGIEPRSPGPLANTLTAGPIINRKKERKKERKNLPSSDPRAKIKESEKVDKYLDLA